MGKAGYFVMIVLTASIVAVSGCINQAETKVSGVKFWAYQIQKQHEGDNIQKLTNSHYDMLVVDNPRTLSDSMDYNNKADIERLKNSWNNIGGKKLVIAYIDIGEAEDYRYYWESGWKVQDPMWIEAVDPDGWSGNYPVKYWHPEWKKIVFGYLDKIVEDGYDGIYMDWIEGFSFDAVNEAARKEGKDSREEMIRFVKEISDYSKAKKPGFIVIAQNAVELGTDSGYLVSVDAVAQEQVWFDGLADVEEKNDCALPEKEGENPPASNPDYCRDIRTLSMSSEYYIKYLENFKKAGKPVFIVDYAEKPENVQKAYRKSYSMGYIPYVTIRSLSRLTATLPPGY